MIWREHGTLAGGRVPARRVSAAGEAVGPVGAGPAERIGTEEAVRRGRPHLRDHRRHAADVPNGCGQVRPCSVGPARRRPGRADALDGHSGLIRLPSLVGIAIQVFQVQARKNNHGSIQDALARFVQSQVDDPAILPIHLEVVPPGFAHTIREQILQFRACQYDEAPGLSAVWRWRPARRFQYLLDQLARDRSIPEFPHTAPTSE